MFLLRQIGSDGMEKKFKKDSKEFQMFGDFYAIVKEFWEPENTLEYNDQVMKALTDFGKKYGVDRVLCRQKDPVAIMAHRLAIAMADYLDDRKESERK